MTAPQAWNTLVEAVLVAVGGGFVTAVVLLVRWLIAVGKQVKDIAESVTNIAAVATATLEMQPPMTKAIRTIIEVTAEKKINGNVEKAHKALDEVDRIHGSIMKRTVTACVAGCVDAD